MYASTIIGLVLSVGIVFPYLYFCGFSPKNLRGSPAPALNQTAAPRRLFHPKDENDGWYLDGVKSSWWSEVGWQAWKVKGVQNLWWGRSNATDAATTFTGIVAAVVADSEGATASLGFGSGEGDYESLIAWESELLALDDVKAGGYADDYRDDNYS